MSTLLTWLAFGLGAASLAVAFCALIEVARAVRIGGARLLFHGIEWFWPSAAVPDAARPHMRAALWRWAYAMLCMVLAGGADFLADAAR